MGTKVTHKVTALATVVVMVLAFAAPAWAVSFSGPADFPAGGAPVRVATGDFNADSIPDLAVVNNVNTGTISVLLGRSEQDGGGFSAPTAFRAGITPVSVAVGDFNADADPDLVVTNQTATNALVLLGGAGGTFSAATPLNASVGTRHTSVAVGDLNADGDPDLVTSNFAFNTVSVLLGGTGSTFSAPATFPTGPAGDFGNGPNSVVIRDFNADGDPDIAVANNLNDNVGVLLGVQGTDGFSAPTNFPVGDGPLSIAAGDFNGDGDPDLATANGTSNDASVLLGGPGGSFSDPTNTPTGTAPVSVAVEDLDGDTDPDLAVANRDSNTVSVLLGGAGGVFSDPTNLAAFAAPRSVAVGDFNADSVPDLVTANNGSANVSVFSNTTTEGPDTTAPETEITGGPTGLTNSATATFEFSSTEDGSTFECKLDDGAFEPCNTPKAYTDLGQGDHSFEVRSTDTAGNVDGTPASRAWTVDTTAPTVGEVTPADSAADVAADTNVTATFSEAMSGASIGASTFELSEQGSTTAIPAAITYDAQSNTATLNPNADLDATKTYTATVTTGVKDEAGNAMAEDKAWSFATATPPDTTAPVAEVTAGPTGLTNSASASFEFSSTEGGSTFECKLDAGAFVACSSPKAYAGLSQGAHAFEVRAKDAAGNVSTPAVRRWQVDTADPAGTVLINNEREITASRDVTLRLSASDPAPGSEVASMRFRNGGTTTWSAWEPYATRKAWRLTAGTGNKAVLAQYRDGAGNVSATARDTITFRR